MKKKYIFISLLTVLIVFLSSIAIGLYDNVEGKITDKSYVINSYLVEDMKYFTLAKTMELDPDFKVFSFGKDVPENVQNSIYERFEDNMTSSVSLLENDSNFIYYVKNKENILSGECMSYTDSPINKLNELMKENSMLRKKLVQAEQILNEFEVKLNDDKQEGKSER